MKRPALLALACAALLLGGFATAFAAPAPAPTPVPRSKPDFSAMKFQLGTWTCHQTVRGSVRPDTGTTTMTLDGAYMVTHDVAPPFDKYRTQPVVTDSYLTYDPMSKLWVTVAVDNFSGYYVSTSPGWSGNTLKTTTKFAAGGGSGYDTLTKVSNTKTTDASVSTDAKGHVTRNTVTCMKA